MGETKVGTCPTCYRPTVNGLYRSEEFLKRDIDALRARVAALEADKARMVEALKELHATVQGEWPSLLEEDSGGNAALACEIEELIGAHAELDAMKGGGDGHS